MTLLAGYAWIWMKIVYHKVDTRVRRCVFLNAFLLLGTVATGDHQEDHRSGKPAVPASLCCAWEVVFTPLNLHVIKKGKTLDAPSRDRAY